MNRESITALTIPVSYRDEWQDGLGAHGWKMDDAIGDPVLIATTAYTGGKVPTSVLIHDMLDHYLSGFGLSGHRNEAMATLQLGLRTGVEIASSYAQQADDILRAGVNGEALRRFLPDSLRRLLPNASASDRELLQALLQRLGQPALKHALIERLWTLGQQGQPHAQTSWRRRGLEYARRTAIGMCLQHLLEQGERCLLEHAPNAAHGHFSIDNRGCTFHMTLHTHPPAVLRFEAAVDTVAYPAPAPSALTAPATSN